MMAGHGMALTPLQLSQLTAFHGLLVERNKTLNLTRIWSLEDMVLKHYVDCLMVARMVPDLPSPLLDLGTGAGFPGVLLKIVMPSLHVILAESVGKKVGFLRELVDLLKVPGLDVVGQNINREFTKPVRGVITRAVEPILETQKRILSCLQPGGLALFMKGPSVDEEKAEVRRLSKEFEEAADHAYMLPGGEHQRRLVVYRRLASRTEKRGAPRRPGR